MRVRVNGEEREVAEDATVADLVAQVPPSAGQVAVAINGEVVPRRERQRTRVRDGDRVEIVAAIQGGSGARGPHG